MIADFSVVPAYCSLDNTDCTAARQQSSITLLNYHEGESKPLFNPRADLCLAVALCASISRGNGPFSWPASAETGQECGFPQHNHTLAIGIEKKKKKNLTCRWHYIIFRKESTVPRAQYQPLGFDRADQTTVSTAVGWPAAFLSARPSQFVTHAQCIQNSRCPQILFPPDTRAADSFGF